LSEIITFDKIIYIMVIIIIILLLLLLLLLFLEVLKLGYNYLFNFFL